MKISKQLLLITPILFLFFATGCSKSLPPTVYAEPKPVYAEPKPVYAEPDSEFFREENVGEFDTARLYEKPGPGPDFGSAPQGMPGDGATGSFSAEPFVGDSGKDKTADLAEPFQPGKKDDMTAPLPIDEEVSRRLPYHASDNLEDIHFAFDSYDLDDQLLTILQKNVAYLKSHPFSKIVIQGYCDERGSNNYNLSLGNQRAHSVKSYLILLGIDESRIHTVSYGEEKPFCFENNEKCWYQNRRVSILVAEKIESAAFKLKVKTNSLVMLKK